MSKDFIQQIAEAIDNDPELDQDAPPIDANEANEQAMDEQPPTDEIVPGDIPAPDYGGDEGSGPAAMEPEMAPELPGAEMIDADVAPVGVEIHTAAIGGGEPSGTINLDVATFIALLEKAAGGGCPNVHELASKAAALCGGGHPCLTMADLDQLCGGEGVDAAMPGPEGEGPQIGEGGEIEPGGEPPVAEPPTGEPPAAEPPAAEPPAGPAGEAGEAETPAAEAEEEELEEEEEDEDLDFDEDIQQVGDLGVINESCGPEGHDPCKGQLPKNDAPAEECDCGKEDCEKCKGKGKKSKKPWEEELNRFIAMVSDSGGTSVVSEDKGQLVFNPLVTPQARVQLVECFNKALHHRDWLAKNGFPVLAEIEAFELKDTVLEARKRGKKCDKSCPKCKGKGCK